MTSRGAIALASACLAGLLTFVAGCPQSQTPVVERDKAEHEAVPPFCQDVTANSGVNITYRDGQEAGHYAILESLGGGVALFDFDGDGLLDIYVPGGGHFDGQKILGHPGKLYKNLGNF